MRQGSAYTCDICKTPKQQTNHWFLCRTHSGQIMFELWDELDASDPTLFHLCGDTCCIVYLARHLASLKEKA